MKSTVRVALCFVVMMGVLLASAGCAAGNKIHNTQVIVQFSTDEVLHIACVPTRLPDGEPATAQRTALLEAVTQAAGGYTLVEETMGGWMVPGTRRVQSEVNDLLLVKGPPDLAMLLEKMLHEDFQQDVPFVISLPVLPVQAQVPPMQLIGENLQKEKADPNAE